MLHTTRDLVATIAGAHHESVRAACALIRKRGTLEDAEALVDAFLAAPAEREVLLSPIRAHGDVAIARQLFEAGLDRERLRDGMPSELLHTVGYLGLPDAEPALFALATAEHRDYYVVRDACLGLLALPTTRGPEIARVISRHEGTVQFPELLPSLACKTGNPLWTHRLVRWGEQVSSSCNGGLILGIALLGDREAFERVLWDPHWEAHDSATGTRYWSYVGARALGLDLRELYASVKARGAEPHALHVLVALLELWIEPRAIDLPMAPESTETAHELLALLFRWSTPHHDDSLSGLVHATARGQLDARVAEVEQRLRLLAHFELELAELRPR